MRWLWRFMVLFVFISLFKLLLTSPQSEAFITWPEKQDWAKKLQWQAQQLQRKAQDLPASVEIEIKRLWNEHQPQGYGKSV